MSLYEHSLTLELASEEYNGPANYTVRINAKNNAPWQSSEHVLTGGHQTERMGRVTEQSMPWQNVDIQIPFSAEQIESIEITFTNDAAKSGRGDRNLFVKRAIVGDDMWLAFDGKQQSTCIPKSSTRQGYLYCNGTLTLSKRATTKAEKQLRFVYPMQHLESEAGAHLDSVTSKSMENTLSPLTEWSVGLSALDSCPSNA